jgi:hypothetical protein
LAENIEVELEGTGAGGSIEVEAAEIGYSYIVSKCYNKFTIYNLLEQGDSAYVAELELKVEGYLLEQLNELAS